MITLRNFGKLLIYAAITLLPIFAKAKAPGVLFQQEQNEKNEQKQDPKKSDKKGKASKEVVENQPEIKQVPKARKQARPTAINTPKVKVKPIKIIRPKIKKP